eukprot:g1327.t1
MKQSDFRALVNAGVKRGAPVVINKSKRKGRSEVLNVPEPKQRKKRKKTEWKLRQEAREKEKSRFRDRAEERRRGINKDYVEAEKLREAASAVSLSIESSKYLGGDIKHTHLVKGLDYALLQKVRAGGGKDKSASLEAFQVSYGSEKINKKNEEQKEFLKNNSEIDCTFLIAENLKKVLFSEVSNSSKKETDKSRFAPGRITYEFSTDFFGDMADLPSTEYQSAVDCPFDMDGRQQDCPKLTLLNQLQKFCFSKKTKRKSSSSLNASTESKPIANSTVVVDEKKKKKEEKIESFDIFQDVGKYIPR